MGLTSKSTGVGAADKGIKILKTSEDDIIAALAGNPNVGKSTVFNRLTGMKQHTGNWPGKTVSSASGEVNFKGRRIILVDIPGTYSLMAHSPEEEAAVDFICFGGADITAVVCDATCLERNLNLVLQTAEAFKRTVICVNLLDEAEKKGIDIDFKALERETGLKAVGMSAREGIGLEDFTKALTEKTGDSGYLNINYGEKTEAAVSLIESRVKRFTGEKLSARWTALRLIEGNSYIVNAINSFLGVDLNADEQISAALNEVRSMGVSEVFACDTVTRVISKKAFEIAGKCVRYKKDGANSFDRRLDKILTGKTTAIPFMLLLLALVFFITIKGANYPSQLISEALFGAHKVLYRALETVGIPGALNDFLMNGVYRVVAWVVSVMLPPMAIFFPMFTLLEDFGYLPRIAFVMDKCFRKCSACGKQALTMAMGFGCNAAGIVGCRIIDSPRERLIAVITNSFVPCNGKFPALIMLITLFFVSGEAFSAFSAAGILLLVVLFGVFMTFLVSKLLSLTVLKGVPSAFTLELPPYRRPRIVPVIVSSVFDRTLFVLGRAVVSSAPAGAVIWLLANIDVGGVSLLAYFTNFLEPIGVFMGLDGVILAAFILGFPANEIVVPIMLMAYMGAGTISEAESLAAMGEILTLNGWTVKTAVCTILFFIMHWPCATACITAFKETKSFKWTALTIAVPAAAGFLICTLANRIMMIF